MARVELDVNILVDTDLLIDILRGREEIKSLLTQLAATARLSISDVTQMELIIGCQNQRDLQQIDKLISAFDIIPIDSQISSLSIGLLRQYRLSHGLLIGDSLIAATGLVKKIELLTRNQRDYRFISDLELLNLSAG